MSKNISIGDRVIYNDQRCQVEKVGASGAYKGKAKLLTADFEQLWVDVDQLDVPGSVSPPSGEQPTGTILVSDSCLTDPPKVEAVRSLLQSTCIDWDGQSADTQALLMKLLSIRSLEKVSGRLHVLESVNKVLPEASRCSYSPIQEERMWDIPHFVHAVKNIKAKVEPNEAPGEILEYYRSCWKRFEKWEKTANKTKQAAIPKLDEPKLDEPKETTRKEVTAFDHELTHDLLLSTTVTTVSLFSGMGGVDCGFKMAGFQPIASVEFDKENQEYSKDCERSHLMNFPDAKFYLEPVQGMAGKLPKCDILQASPVCSHFSAAANMVRGMREEQAEDLEMAHAVDQALHDCSPRYFMMEQVPGYVDSKSFETITQVLETNGYRYDYKILDMADYGVPQNRKRLILLAGRDRMWEFPKEQRRVGWKEAIAGIQLEPCTLTRRQQLQLIKQVADYDLSQGLLIQRIGMNIVVRRHNEPCFTITRSMFVDEKGASRSKVATVINSQGIWNLPLRAIARLCGFPDWFHLGKYAGQGLGYAVPPKFVKLLCSSLISD